MHRAEIILRCIPKMDHHCPWTANCVSHRTFPHFLRFVVYSVAAMSYLEYFLYIRGAVIWNNRHWPSVGLFDQIRDQSTNIPQYLGPSAFQLVHLFLLIVANSIVLFALIILLVRTVWCLAINNTSIEVWEIERHETLLRRARYLGGYLDGPDGAKVRIVRQEFPYDIGIWQNFRQGMGTGNVRSSLNLTVL